MNTDELTIYPKNKFVDIACVLKYASQNSTVLVIFK